jgi:hypothetical protein
MLDDEQDGERGHPCQATRTRTLTLTRGPPCQARIIEDYKLKEISYYFVACYYEFSLLNIVPRIVGGGAI